MLLNLMKSTPGPYGHNISFFAEFEKWFGSVWFWGRVKFVHTKKKKKKKLGSPQNDLWIGLWCIKSHFLQCICQAALMCVLCRTWLVWSLSLQAGGISAETSCRRALGGHIGQMCWCSPFNSRSLDFILCFTSLHINAHIFVCGARGVIKRSPVSQLGFSWPVTHCLLCPDE